MTPQEIIAKAVEPHFDKPHHNLMASEIVRDLMRAGFMIVPNPHAGCFCLHCNPQT